MSEVWLIVAEESVLPGLAETARTLSGTVRAIAVGGRGLAELVAAQADEVLWLATTPQRPAESWAQAVADLLVAAGPAVVLTGSAPASRLLIGSAAARLGAPLLGPVQRLHQADSGIELTRLLYGGIALEQDLVATPVCVVLEAGPAPAEPGREAGAARISEVGGAVALPLVCTRERRAGQTGRDLATAPRVIGVGRGLRDPGYLEEVRGLAETLGAEVACSRPVAEDLGWLPQDRYLGVSGRRISPRLYLMLGISGEVQHMIGVRDAEFIVAVNTDERAPVMTSADIGVVGDLRAFVPALIRQLDPAGRSQHSA